ncbi:hypothetical protein PQX77_011481 [Marasmius sp. AFHP31]|nr:hypothetical protein PQX77_011481 [Marasmius sp. AFHP31]
MTRRIDDHDPQLIFTPEDAWFPGGTKLEYMGTTFGTTVAGARMSFEFTGTGVDVYGTISHNLSTYAVSNYFTLDDGAPYKWSRSPLVRSPSNYNVKMFDARGLKDMAHTLVMEVMVNNSETWIDYLDFMPSEPSFTSSQSASAVSSSSIRSGSNGGALPPSTVAGIAIGAISGLFLILLLAGWCLRRHWRRLKNRTGQIGTAESEQMNARPFLLFASTVEKSRKNAEQPPSAGGGVSQPITDRGPGYQPSILSLDDPPPSYAS